MKLRFVTALTLCLAVAWLGQSAPAATITIINTDGPDANTKLDPIVVNEAPTLTAPVVGRVGTDGYKFYAFEQNPVSSGYRNSDTYEKTSLPTYVTSIARTGNRYLKTTDTLFTVVGTTYTTGFLSDNYSATITFGAGVPSLLRLGMLFDVSSTAGDRASDPAISSPTSSFTSFTLNYGGNAQGNNFVFFEIAGLQAGDQFRIVDGLGLSGFTFDTIPEPASLALLTLGGLLMGPRRKRA